MLGKDGHEREVPLPQSVCRELKGLIDGPMGSGLEGELFILTPAMCGEFFMSVPVPADWNVKRRAFGAASLKGCGIVT